MSPHCALCSKEAATSDDGAFWAFFPTFISGAEIFSSLLHNDSKLVEVEATADQPRQAYQSAQYIAAVAP